MHWRYCSLALSHWYAFAKMGQSFSSFVTSFDTTLVSHEPLMYFISKWQLPVQAVMKIWPKWQFSFSVGTFIYKLLPVLTLVSLTPYYVTRLLSWKFLDFSALNIVLLIWEIKPFNKGWMTSWPSRIKFLPEASFGFRVLSLPASVCLCVCVSLCQSLACPCDNSGPVQASITKFGPKVQNNLLKVSIVLWSDHPWSSRSNLRSNSKFTSFWVCPHHTSSPI